MPRDFDDERLESGDQTDSQRMDAALWGCGQARRARAPALLWLWLLGRATFAGAPEVTGTSAEAGEEEKGLASL